MVGRKTRRLTALGVALWCALAAPAAASVFVSEAPEELAQRSTAIVLGRVVAIESGMDASGNLNTYIRIASEEIVAGSLPAREFLLREAGGSAAGRHEWIVGSPEYTTGERVLVFVAERRDGSLGTAGMAMGKYSVTVDEHGVGIAARRLGEGVASLDPASGRLVPRSEPEVWPLADLLQGFRGLSLAPRRGGGGSTALAVPSELEALAVRERQAAFVYAGARWFEPDDGVPIAFRVDATGDAALGPDVSRAAVGAALDAWSSVPSSTLRLLDGGALEPSPWKGCEAGNRFVFNDPFDEIDDPEACRGLLALGGVCYHDFPTRTVNGAVFKRIFQGKVTFNNGLGGCPYWNACNLAEIATHELGHVIGLGHSEDPDATMFGIARFDGRCAALHADDVAAALFLYPGESGAGTPGLRPTLTPTPSTVPTITPTPSRTPTPTVERRPIRIRGRVEYFGAGRAPVSGVLIELRGSEWKSSTSDANGNYSSGFVPSGTWEIEPAKRGGLGGAVSALDAAEVLRIVEEGRELGALERLACDVTGDGLVTALDARRILDFKVRAIAALPVVEACSGDWLFLPDPVPVGRQLLQSPSTAGGCRPGRIELASLASDAAEQNFLAVALGDCTASWRGDVSASEVTGEVRVRLGRRRGRGRRLQVPLLVEAGAPFRSVEGQLRYDPTELRPLRVDLAERGAARLVAWQVPVDGQVRFAAASAAPIETRRTLLVAQFLVLRGGADRAAVRPLGMTIDETPVAAF